ncbi:hypothetical protein WJX74_009841 [Apatococcus lobatus]|uniref:DNA ligase n=1 Tax=Apatococcus lobatus TaxID=904363 RepID=A0AAW1S2U8_9CHLO
MSIPDHKLIPGTGLIVDGFKYQSPVIKAYLLSHAHSDHYGGITDNWERGPIYCSPITGRLIVHMLGIKPEFVHELPMDAPCMLEGVEVTLVDANHCPGAVQFLFRLPTGETYVHCGDMRFSPKLLKNPLLAAYRNCTAVFLDTTYCNPRFTFPPQEESVEYVAATIERMVQESKDGGPSRLFMVSTYGIGKERILAEVHRRCGFKVFVSERKLGVMQCLELPGLDIDDLFCRDPAASPLHVVTWGYLGDTWPFFKPNFVNMEQARIEAGVDEVIGFVPTGWMYEMKRKAFPVRHKGKCWIHLVPYSEHSSYDELREYVRWLKPQQVIPTVGVGGDDGDKKNAAMLKHFRNLVDETASKARFLSTFQRVLTPSSDLDIALDPASSVRSEQLDSKQSASAADFSRSFADSGTLEDIGSGPAPAAADRHRTRPGPDDGQQENMHGASVKSEPSDKDSKTFNLRNAAEPEHKSPCSGTEVKEEMPDPSSRAVAQSAAAGTCGPAVNKSNDPARQSRFAPAMTNAGASSRQLSENTLAVPESPHILPLQAEDIKAEPAEPPLVGPGKMGSTQLKEPVAADSSRGEAGGASPAPTDNESSLQQLLAVVGGSADEKLAQQLLQQADGDVGRAINFFFDRPQAAAAGPAALPAAAAVAGTATALAPGSASLIENQSRQDRAPKRKAPAALSGPPQTGFGRPSGASNAFAAPGAKRNKALPAAIKHGQKSISSFFGGAEPTKQAARQPHSVAEQPHTDRATTQHADGTTEHSSESLAETAGTGAIADADPCKQPIGNKEETHLDSSNIQLRPTDPQQRRLREPDQPPSSADIKLEQDRSACDAGNSAKAKDQYAHHNHPDESDLSVVQARPQDQSSGDGTGTGSELQHQHENAGTTGADITLASAPAPDPPHAQQALATLKSPQLFSNPGSSSGHALAPIFARPKPKQTKLPHPSDSSRSPMPLNGKTQTPPPSPPHALSVTDSRPASSPVVGDGAPGGTAANLQPEDPPAQGAIGSGQADMTGVKSDGQVQVAKPIFGQNSPSKSGEARQHMASPTAVLSSLTEYDAVGMAPWKLGEKVPYLHIARAFQAIDSTTKRLRIGDALANMFRSILALSPEDMLPAVYLTCGKIAPEYENLELNVGGSTVAAAIVEATGAQRSRLREMYKDHGDLGDVAQACRHTQTTLHRPAPLTVAGVFASLRQMAVEKGPGSAGRRQRSVLALLRSCREIETKYLVRTLVQNLRVGANWRSVIGALARAIVIHQQGARVPKQRLEAAAAAASAAFHQCPNLDILVPAMVDGGIDELEKRCALTPGVPLKPMLAKITEGIPDALKQLKGQAFLAEYKYDGQRAQIHLLPDRSVRVFSRNCEDKTAAFPDVVEVIQTSATDGINGLVLDAELVAVDRSYGKVRLRAFQELSTRARGGVTTDQVTINVCVFVFDLLYVDGESLVHYPLRERRDRMSTSLTMRAGFLEAAQALEFPPHLTPSGAPAIESMPIKPPKEFPVAPTTIPQSETSATLNTAAAAPSHDLNGSEANADAGPADAAASSPPHGPADSPVSGMKSKADAVDHADEDMGCEARPMEVANEDMRSDVEDLSGGQAEPMDQSDAASDLSSGGEEGDPRAAERKRRRQNPGTIADDHPAAVASDAQDLEEDEPEQRSRADQLQELLLESFAAGMEGLMLKTLDAGAAYQPSKRSDSWVKLKRDYCEGLRDSLDLVPIGAWYGQGRKVNWFSPFLMAAWDPEREEFQSVCRCMSGFTDVFYAEATAKFKAQQLPGPKAYYVTAESPSVWFEPTEVWEIRGADLTISPVHKAAVGHLHPDRGVSLRFPRYIRTRDDKRPEDATGPDVITELYQKQTRKMETAQQALQKPKSNR